MTNPLLGVRENPSINTQHTFKTSRKFDYVLGSVVGGILLGGFVFIVTSAIWPAVIIGGGIGILMGAALVYKN